MGFWVCGFHRACLGLGFWVATGVYVDFVLLFLFVFVCYLFKVCFFVYSFGLLFVLGSIFFRCLWLWFWGVWFWGFVGCFYFCLFLFVFWVFLFVGVFVCWGSSLGFGGFVLCCFWFVWVHFIRVWIMFVVVVWLCLVGVWLGFDCLFISGTTFVRFCLFLFLGGVGFGCLFILVVCIFWWSVYPFILVGLLLCALCCCNSFVACGVVWKFVRVSWFVALVLPILCLRVFCLVLGGVLGLFCCFLVLWWVCCSFGVVFGCLAVCFVVVFVFVLVFILLFGCFVLRCLFCVFVLFLVGCILFCFAWFGGLLWFFGWLWLVVWVFFCLGVYCL